MRWLVLLPLMSACATVAPARAKAPHRPVLLVHGIDDDARAFGRMETYLRARGWSELEAMTLTPSDASPGVPAMAQQVARAAQALQARTGAADLDVVSFSMGALVSRYWLYRQGGAAAVAHWVSISGPHHGTLTGYARDNEGTRQMRFGSDLLQDLERDEGQWGAVKVTCLWTPLDLMIVPSTSSVLRGADCQRFPVVVHPAMLWDARVLERVEAALSDVPARSPTRWGAGWP